MALVDSRFRGNDDSNVIPAQAGMIVRTAQPGTPPAVIPVEAGMIVRTAQPGTPPAVIPVEAGMIVRTAQPGTPPAVIPAKAGIHTALTEDERVVAGTGGDIPCVTAGTCSLTVAGFRGNDGMSASGVIPAKAGIHDFGRLESRSAPCTSSVTLTNGPQRVPRVARGKSGN